MFRRLVLVLTVVLLAMARPGFAQFESASLTGTVTDPSGSAIPHANVALRSLVTNVVRNGATSATGTFDFVNVEPGRYTLTAKAPGFKAQSQTFELAVGQRLALNVAMQLGSATETVTVSDTPETIETASSEISNLRTNQQVVDLPLNSRNFTQLVQLAPGVNNHAANASNSIPQGYTSGRGSNGAVVNGNPAEDTVYMFDGIWSTENDAGDIFFFPPVDSIQEFKVQTSSAPAAYGGNPSMINADFRSGTNQFHGVFYEFLRNSDFDAKNYFDSHTKPIPPFHLNQFGANVGGPIIIPHLFSGKDRLFFFADYEGKRQSQAQTEISTVPLPAFHTGNFAALNKQLYVPGTTTPLPGNQVQSIDPTSAKLMALFPAPNINPSNPALINNYIYNGAVANIIDQGDIRVDYRTDKTQSFVRYSKENPDTVTPGYLPAPAVGGGPSRPGQTLVPANQVVIGYGRSISPTQYYEARLGYSRLVEAIIDQDTRFGAVAEQQGIPNANAGNANGLTHISVSGQVGLGDGSGSLNKVNNDWEIDQAWSLIHGNHELKAGFNWRSLRFAFYSPGYPVGSYSFTGVYTGYGLADFLYGRPATSELDVTQYFSMMRYAPSAYIQDNWKLSPRLTLNIGVRDDLVTPWGERHNRLSGFVPVDGGTLVLVGTPPYYGNTITRGRYTNFGPRFGFAWSLDNKTVLRGGAGIFYAFENNNSNPMVKNAPYNGSLIQTNSSGAAGYAAALPISAGFPAQRPSLFPIANSTFNVFSRRYPNPAVNEWNLNLQHQLTSHDVFSLAYVGQTGHHVLLTYNMNEATPGPGTVASRRPFPNLADGSNNCMCTNSIFNSLQGTYEHRLSAGLDFLTAWTWGHSIDESSGQGTLVSMQIPGDLQAFRGNSDFDTRQSVVLSWSYALPIGKGQLLAGTAHGVVQNLIGGWQLNSIDTFQTGSPFTPVMGTSLLNSGTGSQYPNRIGSGRLSKPSITRWYNTADFVSPGAYTYGNSGRNILYGPGTRQFDVSLFKNFGFSQDNIRHLQFRAETFNIANTPQFNNPQTDIGNPDAATITSAGQPVLFQRTSREIQLAAKLYW